MFELAKYNTAVYPNGGSWIYWIRSVGIADNRVYDISCYDGIRIEDSAYAYYSNNCVRPAMSIAIKN